ncbi:hypothetical protein [Paraliobacillus sp. JSM ZJ581]|uniref:type IV pilus modification PilV family protein n=1 Tax=Paraliobacillus sp. JSM ZJ581 TaxID=3342118 RepID=UPI0035A8BD4D
MRKLYRFRINQSVLREEKAMTLVEVLASILLLSIIIVTFLTFFIQSRKTVDVSDEISDATYIAQSEIENTYHISQTMSFLDGVNQLKTETDTYDDSSGQHKFTKTVDSNKVKISIAVAEDGEDQVISDKLKNVLVHVYDLSGKLKGQMETKILWEE